VVRRGKRLIEDILDQISDDIQEYYGLLNELKMGAISKPPEKPDILELYQSWKRSGLPFLAGGYVDQPYLLTVFMDTVQNVTEMMEIINNRTIGA
jgi:hypothetical protein